LLKQAESKPSLENLSVEQVKKALKEKVQQQQVDDALAALVKEFDEAGVEKGKELSWHQLDSLTNQQYSLWARLLPWMELSDYQAKLLEKLEKAGDDYKEAAAQVKQARAKRLTDEAKRNARIAALKQKERQGAPSRRH
jgi:hypothetical protein